MTKIPGAGPAKGLVSLKGITVEVIITSYEIFSCTALEN
jgi:hypothetical protein